MGVLDEWKVEAKYKDINLSDAKYVLIGDICDDKLSTFGIIAKATDEISAWRFKKIINSYPGCSVIVKEAAPNILKAVFDEIEKINAAQAEKEAHTKKEVFAENHLAKVYHLPIKKKSPHNRK